MVLVSVFVRNEEIHSLFQKLSEGLPSLGSKTKMLSLDQCDELMVIYDTILIEVDLLKGFHVIFKNEQIHGCLTSSIILSFNGFGTDSFHTGSSSRISMNFSSGIFPSLYITILKQKLDFQRITQTLHLFSIHFPVKLVKYWPPVLEQDGGARPVRGDGQVGGERSAQQTQTPVRASGAVGGVSRDCLLSWQASSGPGLGLTHHRAAKGESSPLCGGREARVSRQRVLPSHFAM